MSKKTIWQGSLDNFCGIYSAADIISRHKSVKVGRRDNYADLFDKAFLSLLRSAERLGLLTATRIASRGLAGGFTSPQLARVFNQLGAPTRCGLTAITFTDRRMKRLKGSAKRELLAQGASAIVQEHGDTHWIGVIEIHRDGGYFCFDPSIDNNTCRREKIRWHDGVIFLKPNLLRELNAQTH